LVGKLIHVSNATAAGPLLLPLEFEALFLHCYVSKYIQAVRSNEHFEVTRHLQMVLTLEGLGAQSAGVLPLVTMNQLVLGERTRVVERLLTHQTLNN